MSRRILPRITSLPWLFGRLLLVGPEVGGPLGHLHSSKNYWISGDLSRRTGRALESVIGGMSGICEPCDSSRMIAPCLASFHILLTGDFANTSAASEPGDCRQLGRAVRHRTTVPHSITCDERCPPSARSLLRMTASRGCVQWFMVNVETNSLGD